MDEAERPNPVRGPVARAEFNGARSRMTPQQVLARYPGPVILYAAKSKTVGYPLLLALGCVPLFFFETRGVWIVATAMCGLFLAYAAANYLRDTTIELSGWGFSTNDFGGAKTKCAWRAASEFKLRQQRQLSIIYTDANYDDTLVGGARPLPGVYPFDAPVLMELMNALRSRALGFGQSEPGEGDDR